ncbi:MAG: Hsp20/alpha crystallin family protein [Dehalococcoidia bacterium]
MAIERWRPGRAVRPRRPFGTAMDLEREMEDLFRRSFSPTLWGRSPLEEGIGWEPAVDVYEKDDKYIVKAELPGVKKDDIDVSVSGDTLTIKGERKDESETKEENYYLAERSYGSFVRSMALPSTVDADNIEANYDDGVLEVTLPKSEKEESKKVKVS